MSRDTITDAQRNMQLWSQNLEPEMQYESNAHPDFWVRILHIFSRSPPLTHNLTYSYLTILIHRAMPSSSDRTALHPPQALRAANFTNLLFDELLTENEIQLCPTHLYVSHLLNSLQNASTFCRNVYPSIHGRFLRSRE